MSENRTIQLDSDEKEAFVIFDVLNVPGKTRKDVGEAIWRTLHWKLRRGAIARQCGVAVKLMRRGPQPLSNSETEMIAQTVGYDASGAMVSKWHRMYMLWEAQKLEGMKVNGKAKPQLETSVNVDIRGETDAPVSIPAKRTSGKLVSFRLVVISDNLLVVEKIVLDVVGCKTYGFAPTTPTIGAPLEVIEREVELRPEKKEYMVPKARFTYSGRGVDELRLRCISPPGYSYRLKMSAYCTQYPSKDLLTVTSDEFDLHFPKKLKNTIDKPASVRRNRVAKKSRNLSSANDEFSINVIGESLDSSLEGLAVCRNKLLKNVDLELRLYLNKEQSYGDVQAFERVLVKSGIALNEPVAYDSRILSVRFKFTAAGLSKLANIEVAGMLGWQLFDQRKMEKYQKARTTSVLNLGGKEQGGKRNLLLVE